MFNQVESDCYIKDHPEDPVLQGRAGVLHLGVGEFTG